MSRVHVLSIGAAFLLACNGDDAPAAETDASSSTTEVECDVAVPGSCPSDETTTDPATDDGLDLTTDEGGEDDETTATTGTPGECRDSGECSPAFCVAPFNPALGVFGRGPFECVAECVGVQDELKWCADAAACCDRGATCTDRGYCEREDGAGSTGADDTGGQGDAGSTGR